MKYRRYWGTKSSFFTFEPQKFIIIIIRRNNACFKHAPPADGWRSVNDIFTLFVQRFSWFRLSGSLSIAQKLLFTSRGWSRRWTRKESRRSRNPSLPNMWVFNVRSIEERTSVAQTFHYQIMKRENYSCFWGLVQFYRLV